MHTLNVPYFKFKVDNHESLKPRILQAIDSIGVHPFIDGDQRITNTDWHIGQVDRPYMSLMHDWYNYSCQLLSSEFDMPVHCENTWYQQYSKGDYHGWHTHNAFYNGIYYVELDSNASRTTVKLGHETDIEVQEGDILLLPGSILHQSRSNPTDMRKTVVVFNLFISYNSNYAQ